MMRPIICALVFAATIGFSGFAIAQTDDANNPTDAMTPGKPVEPQTSASKTTTTAGTHSVIGVVASISLETHTVALRDIQTSPAAEKSSASGTNTMESKSYLFSADTTFTGIKNKPVKSTEIKAGDRVRLMLDSNDIVQSISLVSKPQ
jgi:hypothetical protein